MATEHGKYIVIEGSDGTGKSTQVAYLRERLAADGIDSVEFHEPEGTPIANQIREIIKDGTLERDPMTNLLLFTAARHEIWKTARHHLSNGTWVVAARNYFSTVAYQGYGQGVSHDLITETTRTFTDELYTKPDLAVILTLNDETERLRRIQERGELEKPDTFESMNSDFQTRVNLGYAHLAEELSLPTIYAEQSPEKIAEEIYTLIRQKGLFAAI